MFAQGYVTGRYSCRDRTYHCRHDDEIFTGGWLDNPEVLTYSDVIPYATAVEPSSPFLSDELAVCHKGVDTFRSEETDKAFHNLLAFLPVGVATFREKTEYQREGNPFIGDAQHKNVDIELSELPVGAIHVPNVDLYAVADNRVYAGFISLSPVAIEMLFIDSDCRGMGYGAALIEFAKRHGATRVDVNEQNPSALNFYKAKGFRIISRDKTDDAGRPYPILHLSL